MSVKTPKTNKDLINEVNTLLDKSSRPLLENFFMDEEPTQYPDREEMNSEPMGDEGKVMEPKDRGSEEATLMGVKDEINQIRSIALKTIARLSDYPTSEGYIMMKKIWNMCDKAMEPTKDIDKNSGSAE